MAATETMFCTECGKPVAQDGKFCAACGHPTSALPPPQPAPPVLPLAATPAPTAKNTKRPKLRWRKKRYWIPAVLIIIFVIAGTTGNHKGSSSPTGSSSSSGDVSNAASVPAPPKGLTDARSYILDHRSDINTVQVSVQSVQAGVAIAQKSPSIDVINQLAQLAQQAHDNLDAVRNDFASSDGGALGDAELEVFSAANDLKNSMGALVAYTGNPNPATLAQFTSQYQAGLSEWNQGIRAIWRIAHRTKPPVV
jgi:hypothetical protein